MQQNLLEDSEADPEGPIGSLGELDPQSVIAGNNDAGSQPTNGGQTSAVQQQTATLRVDPDGFPDQPTRGSNQIPGTLENVRHLLRAANIVARYNVISKRLEVIIPKLESTLDNRDGAAMKACENQIERFLSKEETQRLLDAVDASPNTQLGSIVRLLLLTGCRKRELLDAKWSEIDLQRRVWRIPMERAKTSKTRHVPLSDQALAVIQSLRRWDKCEWLVPNPETMKPYGSIHHAWNKARQAAGLPDLRIHDCRHSFASWLVEAGYSLYVVSKALGHASSRTTERYAHVADETLRGASNAAASLIGQSLGPTMATT